MKGRLDWSEISQQDQDDLELLVLDRIQTLTIMREDATRWEGVLARLFKARVRDAAAAPVAPAQGELL